MGETLESLRAAYSAANSWNEWATGAVTFGVVVELIALLLFGKEMPRNEKLALALGSILVVVGVAGEWVFGTRASAAAVQIQQLSDQKIATLKKDQEADHKIAAQAAAHAADLGVTVGTLQGFVNQKEEQADVRLAEFKKYANDEKERDDSVIAELERDKVDLSKARTDALANAKLTEKDLAEILTLERQEANERDKFRRQFADRELTDAQWATIGSKIKKYAGQEYLIVTYWEANEPHDLGDHLNNTLVVSGWAYKPPKTWMGLMGLITGVIVNVDTGASAKAKEAAKALSDALNAEGLICKVETGGDAAHSTDMIDISVGAKF